MKYKLNVENKQLDNETTNEVARKDSEARFIGSEWLTLLLTF